MTTELEEEGWRKLCSLVAEEADPQRVSELLDQLIEKLDARRQQIRLDRQQRVRATGDK
jgi:hypothetical protein